MEATTFQYVANKGWSVDSFPLLDSENTLIIMFCGAEYINNPAPIEELATFYKESNIIGCSSAGEIFGDGIYDDTITVAIIRFKKTTLKIVKETVTNFDDSLRAGQTIAENLMNDELRGIFVLADGLLVNGSELVKGLNTASQIKNEVVITGGLAGDGINFKNSWVTYSGKIYSNAIVAVGLYGEHIKIGHASRGGWDVFGPERHITRSKHNILYEINEQPALEIYKKILGDKAADLPTSGFSFPFTIRKDHDDKAPLVRTLLGVDEKEQALIFAGDMPTGYLLQLMRGNLDRIIVSANKAGEVAMQRISPINSPINFPVDKNASHPIICIAISCVGRRLLLGEKTEEELESLLESLPDFVQQIGFYSYGELSPYANGMCELHNQTMTLTLFYEG